MELEEAWNKIKAMDNSERFKPNQVHSILADLGVFKTNPRIRLVLKTALTYDLWSLLLSDSISSNQIEVLKSKLQYEGFSKEVVDEVCCSINDNKQPQGHKVLYKTIPVNKAKTDVMDSQCHIKYLGKELGCSVTEMINIMIDRGYRLHMDQTCSQIVRFLGKFASLGNCEVILYRSVLSESIYMVVVEVTCAISFVCELYKRKYSLKSYKVTSSNIVQYIFCAEGGEIELLGNAGSTRIYYRDELAQAWNREETKFQEIQRIAKEDEEYQKTIRTTLDEI